MGELDDVKQRLEQVEARLARLEAERVVQGSDRRFEPGSEAETGEPVCEPTVGTPKIDLPKTQLAHRRQSATMPTASNLLAWGAGSAFVL
ncbi:MAG: hypothetical protein WBA10_06840, partial [Elainellaceae cyanobacterium]